MSIKRTVIVLSVLLACAAGGYFYTLRSTAKTELAADVTLTVTQGSIEEVVTAQGKLEPKEYVDVGVQVSGQIRKLHVELGDVVTAGTLIAEIDPQVYEAQVRAIEARIKTLKAQIAQQQAQLELAGQQHRRNGTLIEKQAISQEAFDSTRAALAVAEAQKTALAAQLEEEESRLEGELANLGYTKIYAPMNGTVVLKAVREGQTVNASQSAPTVVQLADLDVMTARAQVAEADVMRLRTGMPVYFTTLGAQDKRWRGTVRQILPSPETLNDVVLYNVLADVGNEDRRLMTGMSAQMFFVLGRAENVPLLPVAALGPRVGDAYRVTVLSGGAAQERDVRIGLMNRSVAEVREGLAVGDRVQIRRPAGASADSGPPGIPRGMRGMPRL